MLGRRFGLNVGIGAVLAFAVACTSGGGEGDPTTAPTVISTTPPVTSSAPSTSVAPTSTAPSSSVVPTTGPNVRPGETVPTLPAGADRNSRPGASQFALYWFQALDWGYATTSSVLARQLYLPPCTGCARFMTIFDSAADQENHFEGGRLTVKSRQIIDGDSRYPGSTVVDAVVAATAVREVSATGAILQRAKAVPGIQYRLWVVWRDGAWKLLDYKRVVVR